ncbi:transcription initiation factor tfiid subunit 3 [Anaeramoeba flamelloides]|uniref:Transcription initiation factor tfiid subunit 3 n=1 Tax=Anaeramoeba flamelloides TaxID=1746091 RepID=A0ABQ8XM50_9EUKA|nr:transcription initiation factor tfiid subunit 3 [Anaeramoeba flamelloides]
MFIKPKGYLISQVSFNPHLQNLNNNLPTNCSLSEKVVEWVKEILQEPNLTVEELLAVNCLFLLNIINRIVPSKVNKVLRTSVEKKQEIQNVNEFMRTLKDLDYTKIKKISPQDFLNKETENQKRILKSIIYLKTRYEEKGNLKEFSKSTRTFYILQPKDSTENENNHNKRLQIKQNIDLNSENYLKTELVNPYLVSENCDLSENSWEFENIFFMGNEKKLSILKEKRIELGDLLSGDETTDFSEESLDCYSSTDDLDENGWNLVDLKQAKELESVSLSNPIHTGKKELGTKSKKEKEKENENNKKKIKNENKRRNEKEKKKNKEQKKEKENEKEKEKESKLKSKIKLSLEYNQNSQKKGKGKNNNKRKQIVFSSSTDSNTSSSENNDSESEENSKQNISQNKSTSIGFEEKKELKDNLELISNEDLYEKIEIFNPKNDYIKHDLYQLFQLKNESQSSSYIYTLFFILNKFNGWDKNHYQNSINFIQQLSIKKYDQLIENAFSNCKNLIKIGHAKFLIQFHLINQERGLLYDKDDKKMDDDDELENKEPNIINNKHQKKVQEKNEDENNILINNEKNLLINNGYIELTEKKLYIYKNNMTQIFHKIKLRNQIKLEIHKIYLNKLNLIFIDDQKIKRKLNLIFNSEIERLNFLIIIISFLRKNPKYLKNDNSMENGNKKNKKSKNDQKNNNVDDDLDDVLKKGGEISEKNIKNFPNSKPPNKHFIKKMSSIDEIKDKSNIKKHLKAYYTNSGVNFLIRILPVDDNNNTDKNNNNKKMKNINEKKKKKKKKSGNFKNGYIKIRKNGLKIGIEKSTVEKIQFKNSPMIFKFPKNRVKFNIQWNSTRSCRTTKESSIILKVSSTEPPQLNSQYLIISGLLSIACCILGFITSNNKFKTIHISKNYEYKINKYQKKTRLGFAVFNHRGRLIFDPKK